ncbi:MAG: hypothetical protein ACLTIC_12110, partial [Waltera sp.]
QEKRFWSADQKRFVYSLSLSAINLAERLSLLLHPSLFQFYLRFVKCRLDSFQQHQCGSKWEVFQKTMQEK